MTLEVRWWREETLGDLRNRMKELRSRLMEWKISWVRVRKRGPGPDAERYGLTMTFPPPPPPTMRFRR
jgi:hypothetical protein